MADVRKGREGAYRQIRQERRKSCDKIIVTIFLFFINLVRIITEWLVRFMTTRYRTRSNFLPEKVSDVNADARSILPIWIANFIFLMVPECKTRLSTLKKLPNICFLHKCNTENRSLKLLREYRIILHIRPHLFLIMDINCNINCN